MAERYVVYVSAPTTEPSADARRRLGELLRLDPDKLDALLRRLPGEVTKPVPEATALTVARRFREAGLDASMRPVGQQSDAPAVAEPAERPNEARTAVPATTATPKPYPDRDSREAESSMTDAEDDELFPASAFERPRGPKAPSLVLVVSFFVVLGVLVGLWLLL